MNGREQGMRSEREWSGRRSIQALLNLLSTWVFTVNDVGASWQVGRMATKRRRRRLKGWEMEMRSENVGGGRNLRGSNMLPVCYFRGYLVFIP